MLTASARRSLSFLPEWNPTKYQTMRFDPATEAKEVHVSFDRETLGVHSGRHVVEHEERLYAHTHTWAFDGNGERMPINLLLDLVLI